MSVTANGYPVIRDRHTSGSFPRLREWQIPGTGRHLFLRDGAMGFILAHVALWFHESIERLNIHGEPWDEWGWAVRPIRGQTSGYSNHAGGGAIDLNSTQHPLGVAVSHTFTKKQIRAIKLRMLFYRKIVIWGGVWRRPDGEHFEIAKVSLKRCNWFARVLMKTPRGLRILKVNPGAKAVIQNGH
jgi:hypothetical protein